MDLAHSDVGFVQAYPSKTTKAFLRRSRGGFAFSDKVPQSILYDNIRFPVAWVPGDGRRQRTRACSELESHDLFADRFGQPGNGKVEGLIASIQPNYLVPLPHVAGLVHTTRFC